MAGVGAGVGIGLQVYKCAWKEQHQCHWQHKQHKHSDVHQQILRLQIVNSNSRSDIDFEVYANANVEPTGRNITPVGNKYQIQSSRLMPCTCDGNQHFRCEKHTSLQHWFLPIKITHLIVSYSGN